MSESVKFAFDELPMHLESKRSHNHNEAKYNVSGQIYVHKKIKLYSARNSLHTNYWVGLGHQDNQNESFTFHNLSCLGPNICISLFVHALVLVC